MARPLLKQTAILVGGTGFYLRALLQPDHLPPTETDPSIRNRLKEHLAKNGAEVLYDDLQKLDPRRAAQLHPNDTIRVIRALEVIEQTGKPVPETPTDLAFPVQLIGLAYADRDKHRQVIRTRLHQMMAEGFLEEVESLVQTYGFCAAMQKAHGYPELVDVLAGKRTLEEALLQIEINIRQYARRQMTWFRKMPDIRWFYVDETDSDTILVSITDERDCF
jgi:tRNA dimethylallyltransferase